MYRGQQDGRPTVGAVDIDRRWRLERERGVLPNPPHHHQQPNSLQTAAGMAGPMPLTLTLLLLLMVVQLSWGGTSTDSPREGRESLKRQEFTEETTTTVKSTSTDSKLLTVQSSEDPRYGQDPTHDPEGGGGVSESESVAGTEEKSLLTRRTSSTPMSALEYSLHGSSTSMSPLESHGAAICHACLYEDPMQDICKSCEWKNGIYLLETTREATTTREARATSETPGEVVDPVDKPVEKSVEQPIDKINISAFVSDFNADSPDSSSEVRQRYVVD